MARDTRRPPTAPHGYVRPKQMKSKSQRVRADKASTTAGAYIKGGKQNVQSKSREGQQNRRRKADQASPTAGGYTKQVERNVQSESREGEQNKRRMK